MSFAGDVTLAGFKSIDNALSRIRRKLPQVAPDQAGSMVVEAV